MGRDEPVPDPDRTVVDVRRASGFPCLDDNSLAALLDGEVEEARRRDIESHLDGCSSCRALVADLVDDSSRRVAAGGTLVATNPDEPVPPSWLKRLRHEVTIYQPGQMIDHFRVLREIGRGGMGEVYLAEDTKLARKVALKVVSQQHLTAPQSRRALDRFMREARTTARVSHPNIVTIHAVGEHAGKPYLALEYVKGKPLRQLMEEGRIALPQVIHIAASIAEALVEAHRHGVLHRDLKPENVLVGNDGRVRVLDFGLAETVEHVEDTHRTESRHELGPIVTGIVGTPKYMAPEQWEDQERSGATDVWALGLILYEMLSGKHPYEAERTMLDLASAVCSMKSVSPLPAGVRAPPELRLLCARMVSKSSDERPDAVTVATELVRLDRVPKSRLMRARSSPLVWAALTVGAASLAVVGFLLVSRASADTVAADTTPARVAEPTPTAEPRATTAPSPQPVAAAPTPSAQPSAPPVARGRIPTPPKPPAPSAEPPPPPPVPSGNPLDEF